MDDLWFTMITMPGLTVGECHDVHRMVVDLVHDHNIKSSDRMAIAYPDYRLGIETDATQAEDYGEEQRLIRLRKGFLGRSIRLFGSAKASEQLRPNFKTGALDDSAGLVIDDPKLLLSATQYSSYIGHKGLSKLTPSRLRRAIRRQAWQRDPACLTPAQLERKQVEYQQRAMETHLPYVGVRSRSTGQSFSLFVRQLPADELRFAPNAYGFSTTTQVCSIPTF